MPTTQYLSQERVQVTLRRIASEIIERNRGLKNVVVVGIQVRGVSVAKKLAVILEEISGESVSVGELDTKPYRDDRDLEESPADRSRLEIAITDRDVVLVDDVLFTGRTVRAALDALIRYGRPKTIQLTVLIDRGHREYPICPDYVGRVVQTKHRERVRVQEAAGLAVYIDE